MRNLSACLVPRRRPALAVVALVAAMLALLGLASVPASTAAREPAAVPLAVRTAVRVPAVGVRTRGALARGVVNIDASLYFGDGASSGTGIVIGSGNLVLTNHHVIEGATSLKVTNGLTGASYFAHLVGSSPSGDVALLQLDGGAALPTATLGSEATLRVGRTVRAVGNAFGRGGAPTLTTGRVVALNRTVTVGGAFGEAETLRNVVVTSAPLAPGNSGGPLLDSAGRVVGMNSAGNVTRSGWSTRSYAIGITRAMGVAQQILAGQPAAGIVFGVPGFLGVQPSNRSGVAGVVVDVVLPNTPAAGSGLAAGDVLTSIGGAAVTSVDSLSSVMQGHRPGDVVTITWTNGSGQHSADVTLIAGPAV